MDQMLNHYYWMRDNYQELLISLSIILIGLQAIVRLTPTKKDDGALERVAKVLNSAMAMLKVPNVKREDGKLVAGKHDDK